MIRRNELGELVRTAATGRERSRRNGAERRGQIIGHAGPIGRLPERAVDAVAV